MINDEIRDKEVRLQGVDGEQLGIFELKIAQEKAEALNLDLVKISPKAVPPVCRIMDYSKYKFDKAKKAKEARKKQKIVDLKEIRLSPNIDKHDVEVKAKNAIKFLSSGAKVKVSLRFRGREMGYVQAGREIMNSFAEICSEVGVMEKSLSQEGRQMFMYLAPKGDK
ncbi:MAG: translation initiation factor IF-3 [Lachnospirales bacterium]